MSSLSSGRVPMICIATVGSTTSCAFDDVTTIGPVCQEVGVVCSTVFVSWFSLRHVSVEFVNCCFFLLPCRRKTCGFTSMQRTQVLLPSALSIAISWTGHSMRTPSTSTPTSGCSRRLTAARCGYRNAKTFLTRCPSPRRTFAALSAFVA